MCGIVGFTGRREASPILLEGLRRLEYRGYDSAGLVTGTGSGLHVRKKAGRLAELSKHLAAHPAPGGSGISHTRWATHGGATDRNSHPHLSADGGVAVVHNGVIENYAALKHGLQEKGVEFRSDTDTEVLAHLIGRYYDGDLAAAVRRALARVKGTYGIAVMARHEPGLIVGARLGSPLVVGVGATAPTSPATRTRWPVRPTGWCTWRHPEVCTLTRGPSGRCATRTCPPGVVSVKDIRVPGRGRPRNWGLPRTTCSRRSTRSRRRWRTECAGGWTRTARPPTSAGLNLSPQQLPAGRTG
jgi:hypothetical protein